MNAHKYERGRLGIQTSETTATVFKFTSNHSGHYLHVQFTALFFFLFPFFFSILIKLNK